MMKLFIVLPILVLIFGLSPATGLSQTAQVWVPPKAGTWKVSATDEENTNWTADMRIEKRGVRNKLTRYRGYFSWLSEDGETAGREYFNGTFDRKRGKLLLKAYRVKSKKGELGLGNYRAFVNRKGRNISSGVWSGAETVPGTWSATWVKF